MSIDQDFVNFDRLGVNANINRGHYTKPSVHCVREHENALALIPSQKEVEGPYFRVVQTSDPLNRPRLEDFPNGKIVTD